MGSDTTLNTMSGPGRAVGSILILFVASVLYGVAASVVMGDTARTQAGLLAGLAVQEIVVVGGLTLLFLRAAGQDVRSVLGRTGAPYRWSLAMLLAAPGFVVLQAPVLDAWARLTHTGEPGWYTLALDVGSPLQGLAVTLAVAVLPPIFEELAFRGYLLRELALLGATRAVAVQAGLFALYHFDLFGAPIYLAAGVVLGLVRLRSGALWPAILFHAINNGIGILDWNLEGQRLSNPGGLALATAAVAVVAAIALATRRPD